MNSKTIEYYMSLPYKVEIYQEHDNGGFTAVVPELPGCMTTADDFQALQKNIEDAKELWFQVALEDGNTIPEPVSQELKEYSGKFLIRIPKSVHRDLAMRAEEENTSLNQLVLTMLVKGLSRSETTSPSVLEQAKMKLSPHYSVTTPPISAYRQKSTSK